MSCSKNDSKSHSKRDHFVSTQRSLTSFFAAKKICLDELQDRSKVNNEDNVSTNLQNVVDNNVEKNIFVDALDIGNFIDSQSSNLNDNKKYLALTKIWKPDSLYNFPKDKDSRKFQLKWLNDFPWLSYSKKYEGVYCRTCVLFSRDVGGRSKEHLVCSCQIKFKCSKEIEENRKKLVPIVNTIFLCGRQNFPLRGHRDDGDLIPNSVNNEGNFTELLKFRVDAGDDVLKNHLQNCPKNASFISKTTQNDLIDCCA
ncbi:52 kDa repressor of the inhibitor of the protein kinase-like, partial [Aphis craccivora]